MFAWFYRNLSAGRLHVCATAFSVLIKRSIPTKPFKQSGKQISMKYDPDTPLADLRWNCVKEGARIASLLYAHFGDDATVGIAYQALRKRALAGAPLPVPGLGREYYERVREVFGISGISLPVYIGTPHGRPLVGALNTGYAVQQLVHDDARYRLRVTLDPAEVCKGTVDDFKEALEPFARQFDADFGISARGNELVITAKPIKGKGKPGSGNAFLAACTRMLGQQR